MVKVLCIGSIKNDQGKIIGYRLKDDTGAVKDIKIASLNSAIKNGLITIVNREIIFDTDTNSVKEPFVVTRDLINKIDSDKYLKLTLVDIKKIKQLISKYVKSNTISADNRVIRLGEYTVKIEDNAKIEIVSAVPFVLDNNPFDKLFANTKFSAIELCKISGLVYGKSMFENCMAKSILIHDMTITDYSNRMFANCYITNLDIRGLKASGLVNVDGLFDNSVVTTNLELNFDMSSVTSAIRMFACSKMGNIKFNFDIPNLKVANQMFYSCDASNIDLSALEATNVFDFSQMFRECSVNTLDISGLSTSKKLVNMHCEDILSRVNAGENIGSIQDMFFDSDINNAIIKSKTFKTIYDNRN